MTTAEQPKTAERPTRTLKLAALTSIASLAIAPLLVGKHAPTNRELTGAILDARLNPSDLESTTGDIVSQLTGDSVSVTCDTSRFTEDSYGAVVSYTLYGKSFRPDHMFLKSEVCEEIAEIASTKIVSRTGGFALGVAIHEYEHIQDRTDRPLDFNVEAYAQCRAIAKYADYTNNLHVPPDQGRRLAQGVAADMLTVLPPHYVDPLNCRPGGSYVRDLEAPGMTPLVYFNPAYIRQAP